MSVPPAVAGGFLLNVIMWNDTDTPLAYLITFRSYGTWLHGDERGSTDRFHNRYGAPFLPSNPRWNDYNREQSKREPVILDDRQRTVVEAAIRETCNFRQWALLAVNVRTNHVHVVVGIDSTPVSRALNALKANATRHMREKQCWNSEGSQWSDKGSTRYLWTERSVERAIEYVVNGQGGPLPVLDDESPG